MKAPLIACALSLGLVSSPAISQDESQKYLPHWYGSLHLGDASTRWNQGDQEYSYLNVGLSTGYRFTEVVASEFLMTFSSNGDTDPFLSEIIGTKVETKSSALAIYLTAQSPGDYYVKARAGLAQSRFTYAASGYEDETENAIGFSYGLGAGMNVSQYYVDVDYVFMPTVKDPLFAGADYDTKVLMLSVGTSF